MATFDGAASRAYYQRRNQVRDEEEIEKRIQKTNPTSNRLKPEDIDGAISDVKYHQFDGTTLTVCCIVLKNGYCVTGESAAVDPLNFNASIGRQVAFKNAREKIWSLEGYLLRESLHRAPKGEPSVSRVHDPRNDLQIPPGADREREFD
jgi:hypothetical protein